MKPMLADDWDEKQVRFPVLVEPKIDGVRGLNMHGGLTGRSLKLFKNKFTTQVFSQPEFKGFDGELAAAHECDPELCRKTSSATGTITGEPFLLWWLFDYVTEETKNFSYHARYKMLCDRVTELRMGMVPYAERLQVVSARIATTMDQLEAYDAEHLEAGYEGTIIRRLDGPHKQGRSTVREGGLLRIKRFVDEEAVVIGIIEGEKNNNEAQTNELGHTFRSSHQENMVPNGMVGNLQCKNVKDGADVTVSPGRMPHGDREFYFRNPHMLVGKIIKYQHFPKGVKDKPRFPTFQCIRQPEDM